MGDTRPDLSKVGNRAFISIYMHRLGNRPSTVRKVIANYIQTIYNDNITQLITFRRKHGRDSG